MKIKLMIKLKRNKKSFFIKGKRKKNDSRKLATCQTTYKNGIFVVPQTSIIKPFYQHTVTRFEGFKEISMLT